MPSLKSRMIQDWSSAIEDPEDCDCRHLQECKLPFPTNLAHYQPRNCFAYKEMPQNDEVFILVPYFRERLPGVIVNCEFIFVEHYGTFVILIVAGLNLAEWAEPFYLG
jgi:hypothetical protein